MTNGATASKAAWAALCPDNKSGHHTPQAVSNPNKPIKAGAACKVQTRPRLSSRAAHHSTTAKTPLAHDHPSRMPCSPSQSQASKTTVHCATSPAWTSA